MTDYGVSAFPHPGERNANGEPVFFPEHGMTLRDYFAAHAPAMPEQWYLDSPRKKSDPLWHWGEASAAWAYFYADAMLAARSAAEQGGAEC